jgi:plasmid segregation protein ParM
LLEGQTVKLEYKGSIKIMNFANVKAYPESAGIVILDKDKYKGPYLVVDIGGRTVDVSYFEGTKLVKTGSYDLGMLTLYSNIVKFVNDRNPTDYGVIAAENIIKTHTITVDGDDKLFDPTRLMKEHTEEILRRVKLDFPWKTSKRVFIGGGAYELKEFIPGGNKIRLEDIFLNAKVFYKVGVDKYGGN